MVIDEDTLHLKVNVGVYADISCAPRSITYCSHAIMPDAPSVFVVKNSLEDPRYA
jgi:hypothetical protein